MKIVLGILRILLYLILAITVITNALSSYVILAPDSFPKPFYVVYAAEPLAIPAEVTLPSQPSQPSPQAPNETAVPSEITATPAPIYCAIAFLCPSSETGDPSSTSNTPTPTVLVPSNLQPGQGIMVDTGAKVVNLADPGGRRFVRVSIVLEFAPNNPAYYTSIGEAKSTIVTTFTTDLSPKLPVVNDVLVTVLSSKTFEQVYSPDGKDALRKEIIEQLNARLSEYSVIYVYFTEFAVQ
jgi:flagellar protein FliL